MQVAAETGLLEKLRDAREQTDRLFGMVRVEALYDRPIAERHRLIFYVGHLEAFDWNIVCLRALGRNSFHSEFDQLFEFGIDPMPGSLPSDRMSDWPSLTEIERYRARSRQAVDDALEQGTDIWPFFIALEHRLMHAETLAYLLHRLPMDKKQKKLRLVAPVNDGPPQPSAHPIYIPPGEVMLGRERSSDSFGWDNEFLAESHHVPAFSIDTHNITNGEFLKFVRAGGYEQRSLWSDSSWNWIQANGICHPNFWRKTSSGWMYDTMFQRVPLPLSWPVYVSHAEAEAYARWRGRALPTEAQYHRAAFGMPEAHAGEERSFPWGDSLPKPEVHGNFDAVRWNPRPVGSHPEGKSAFGVEDLMSNGWEWTSTVFAPFRGFEPFPLYPGYSANFFDGEHYVLKGASPRTPARLLRRSFRNWFQPYYSNIYATFRCVDN